jgi:hypothetical protein
MALNYKILERKPDIILKDFDGNDIVCKDLLNKSLVSLDILFSSKLVIVDKYYVARPDLISLAVYGTDQYADIICKVNGISNPFELNEGDAILLPNISSLNGILLNNAPSLLISDNDSIGSVSNNYQKMKNEARTSNEQIIGEKNYYIDRTNNLIYY